MPSVTLLAAMLLLSLVFGREPAKAETPQINFVKQGDHFVIMPQLNKPNDSEMKVLIPTRFDENAVKKSINEAVWNNDKKVCIIFMNSNDGGFIAALFFNQKILVKAVDVSWIESANFSKLGKKLSDLKSFSTVATAWFDRDDKFLQVKIVTTVKYSSGSSATAEEKQIFSEGGVPIWG